MEERPLADRRASIPRQPSPVPRRCEAALTLLEVMIALAIFFMAVFAILGMVSNTLRNARALNQPQVDAGILAAQLALTNRLDEGSESGDFEDLYPGYTWTREIYEVETNRLFAVDFAVQHRSGKGGVTTMTILLFRPDSPPGQASGGFGTGFRR
jgi:type II secretion system protein I